MDSKDSFGDRMKTYEALSTSRRAFKGQPIVARLDGKGFHKFTKGLTRPFDQRLHDLMTHVTKDLVDRFGANVGYTQSDEITLVWFVDSTSASEYPFGGRFQKMESLLAAHTSVKFCSLLGSYLPEKEGDLAIFDCRAFVVPNLLEAYHEVLWRHQDCGKNAISMAAHSMFSHKSLQGLHGPEMVEKMYTEQGVVFADYPNEFRFGTFVRRVKVVKDLDPITVEQLKAKGVKVPDGPVERSEIQYRSLDLRTLANPIEWCLKGSTAEFKA